MSTLKSCVVGMSVLWEHILADCRQRFPDLETEFERDLVRFKVLMTARGLPFPMVDLPQACKHLDRCLSRGLYTASGLPTTSRVSRRVVIPKFLRGLYLEIFHEDGCLREDYSLDAIIYLRQLLLFAKKVTVPCSPEDTTREIESYLAVDRELSAPSRAWCSDDPSDLDGVYEFTRDPLYQKTMRSCFGSDSEAFDFATNLDRMSRLVCSFLGAYHPSHWSFKHGPGAVSNLRKGENKYVFTNWSDRLERVYPYADNGFHSYSAWASAVVDSERTSCEAYSRLHAVPKTLDKPRIIAAEPSEHQWCQQNIWHFLRARTRSSLLGRFLVFNDQGLNQRLCLEGSEHGRLGTLDLSSASDTVSCRIVQCMFWRQPSLLRALHATRTRFLEYSLRGKTLRMPLRKFATMGSACTFPIESIVFLTVALACVFTKRRLRVTEENLQSIEGEVAVFGDDIVYPIDCREMIYSALDSLEFKVNETKSFAEGNFRESCGVDAFFGKDVSPAYWNGPNDHSPERVASTVAVSNNFLMKGMWRSARYLASTVRSSECSFVSARSGVFGLKTFSFDRTRLKYKTRYNDQLMRYEVKIPQFLVAVPKTKTEDDSALLQYFTEAPDPTTLWSSGIAQRPRLTIKPRWVAMDDIIAQ